MMLLEGAQCPMIIQKVVAVKFQSALMQHTPQTSPLDRMKHTNLSAQVELLTSIMCMTTITAAVVPTFRLPNDIYVVSQCVSMIIIL